MRKRTETSETEKYPSINFKYLSYETLCQYIASLLPTSARRITRTIVNLLHMSRIYVARETPTGGLCREDLKVTGEVIFIYNRSSFRTS